MPTYCFRLPSGEVIDSTHPMSNIPKKIVVDGKVAVRDFMSEQPGVIGTSRTHRVPRDDLGVHPSQVGELNALLKRRGCKQADFDEFGSCIPDDKAHVNAICEATGRFDQDAGYGDKTPGLANVVKDNV